MNYEIIDFKNLPDKSTGISAQRLNKMQFNTQEALEELEKEIEEYTPSTGGGDTLPIGTILPYGSEDIPTGYLLANGQLVSRADYSELFNLYGTKYGVGDGSTTFGLPDLRERVAVGLDENDTDFNELGKTGGEKEHTLTIDEMPSHSHNFQFDGTAGDNNQVVKTGGNNAYGKATSSTGGDQPHNNLQPYIVTNYIIKAKKTSDYTPADTLPLGSIVEYDGDTVPEGYEEVISGKQYKEYKLYSSDGSSDEINLSDNVINYEYIEIFFRSNDNAYNSVKVNNPNGKNVCLINMTPNSTSPVLYIKATIVNIDGTKITFVDGVEAYGAGGITEGNKNYITKVIGCKEV